MGPVNWLILATLLNWRKKRTVVTPKWALFAGWRLSWLRANGSMTRRLTCGVSEFLHSSSPTGPLHIWDKQNHVKLSTLLRSSRPRLTKSGPVNSEISSKNVLSKTQLSVFQHLNSSNIPSCSTQKNIRKITKSWSERAFQRFVNAKSNKKRLKWRSKSKTKRHSSQ